MSESVSLIADALYNSGCLKFGTFRIKSGALSPYYIDLACLLSSPKDMHSIVGAATDEIRRIMTFDKVDKLASIELRGALIATNIAYHLNLPCLVVRKEMKTYGVTGKIVGGEVAKGENILFFDDVISEGASKIEGIRPLEELGAHIKNVLVVVDREQGGKENLEKLGYRVYALAKISDIITSLFHSARISKEHANTILNYIKNY